VSSVGVSQGHRGDCWFVAAVSSLANLRPDVIARLFESRCPNNYQHEKGERKQQQQQQQQSYNKEGVYGVWLYWDGSWQHQLIDDWFPCTPVIDGTLEPLGAKMLLDKNEKTRPTATLELWVALLEKAAAKLAGSYLALDGGGVFEALRTLTGSPCTIMSRDTMPSDKIWNELLQLRRDGCVMVASPSKQAPDVGLTVAHLYGIIDVHRSKRSGVRFVRVQNPWGFSKFSGPYSVNSFAWDSSIRNELRAKIPKDMIRVSKTVTRDENGKLGIQFTKSLVLTETTNHAQKLGLEVGMRILRVNGVEVETQDQVLEALSSLSKEETIEIEFENRRISTEQSSHIDSNDQHGSFWMDFRDFVMCFDKICVAHVARTFDVDDEDQKVSDQGDTNNHYHDEICLSTQINGSHGSTLISTTRTQPHRFGFGLWGRDISLKQDGEHVTTLYKVISETSSSLNVSVLLEYANPRREFMGTTVMGPRMAALNTCFLAVFELETFKSGKEEEEEDSVSPSLSAQRLHRAIESAFNQYRGDKMKGKSPKLIAFAKDIDGYNASLRKLTIQPKITYCVLVGSLPHDSSVSSSTTTTSIPQTNEYRLNFYNRQTKDKTIKITKLTCCRDFSLRISSALLTGSFCPEFSFVPTWNKAGWFDRKSRGLHCPQSVSIQRVALRLLRLQIRCCEQRNKDLPPTLAFRPLLCLVVRTINDPSIRSDSQTKSYALASLVELLRSRWAFNNRQVPDTKDEREEYDHYNNLTKMEQAGWRVCAPQFSSKIIVPLREAVSLCTFFFFFFHNT
jgi:hypothetical protein